MSKKRYEMVFNGVCGDKSYETDLTLGEVMCALVEIGFTHGEAGEALGDALASVNVYEIKRTRKKVGPDA